MSLTSDSMSPADIRACTANNTTGGYGGGMGFGGDGAWWIIILFLFVFCGWGNGFGGFGGNGGGMNGGVGSEVQRGFDHSSVVTKLDGISNGICDSTYALNNTMTNGFSNAELSRCNQQAALMQQLNNMAMQSQQCCCETQRSIDGVKFTIAQEDCATRNLMQSNTRDVIENQNSNARAILDALTAQRIEAKDEKIAEQASLINALNLAASQSNQTNAIRTSIINELRNCPVPSYQVPNPNCCYGPWGGMNWAGFNGYNNGSCGC